MKDCLKSLTRPGDLDSDTMRKSLSSLSDLLSNTANAQVFLSDGGLRWISFFFKSSGDTEVTDARLPKIMIIGVSYVVCIITDHSPSVINMLTLPCPLLSYTFVDALGMLFAACHTSSRSLEEQRVIQISLLRLYSSLVSSSADISVEFARNANVSAVATKLLSSSELSDIPVQVALTDVLLCVASPLGLWTQALCNMDFMNGMVSCLSMCVENILSIDHMPILLNLLGTFYAFVAKDSSVPYLLSRVRSFSAVVLRVVEHFSLVGSFETAAQAACFRCALCILRKMIVAHDQLQFLIDSDICSMLCRVLVMPSLHRNDVECVVQVSCLVFLGDFSVSEGGQQALRASCLSDVLCGMSLPVPSSDAIMYARTTFITEAFTQCLIGSKDILPIKDDCIGGAPATISQYMDAAYLITRYVQISKITTVVLLDMIKRLEENNNAVVRSPGLCFTYLNFLERLQTELSTAEWSWSVDTPISSGTRIR